MPEPRVDGGGFPANGGEQARKYQFLFGVASGSGAATLALGITQFATGPMPTEELLVLGGATIAVAILFHWTTHD